MRKYYLAYGSNLNVNQMAHRCPNARAVGTGAIPGYELLFKGSKTGAYLTIEKAADSFVPVAVWAVTPEDEAALDRYEGCPNFYYKKEIAITMRETVGGKLRAVKAFAYIMHEDREPALPRGEYVNICARGYQAFHFNPEALRRAIARTKELINERH